MRNACILIISFIFIITGCSIRHYKTMSQSFQLGVPILQTTNQVKYVELTYEKVETFMASSGINTTLKNTSDQHFLAVDENWITNTVITEYKQFLKDLNLENKYESEVNDCDDYSRTFTFFCKIKSRRTNDFRYSMAVADVFYHVAGNKRNPHAINGIIVLTSEGKLKLVYIEPQTGIIFAESEKSNISKNVYFWSM